MSLQAVIGATLALGSSVAAARPIAVELDGATAFDADELTAALAVRLPETGDPVRVQVTPSAGGVTVAIGGAIRVVALGDSRGPDAARLVALAASDLVLDDLAVAPEVDAAPGVTAITTPAPSPARAARPLAIGILGGTASGWDGTVGSLTVDVAVPRGRWSAAFDIGGITMIDGPLAMTGAVIRAGAGLRIGAADVRAGVTAVPLSVSTGGGDRTILVGGGASVRLHLAITRGVGAVLAAGFDVFATRTEYWHDVDQMSATPWWTPWLSAGIEVLP